ncbi:C6 zinc finger domain protein [Sporothrix brasiliensis 5110]|uniref:C6 zinc finger domain protein n=1 Tax=Sporothrix brasiliensis 5110 TaxID=1398154 RepID=A0A0C2J1Z2_9PEZI|nr:C6 zinc finger domain protein [Sporothrix brasiliensis 5110]KIH95336.1 C6 zinc finger domain protein [Sporothrix brasiliensis 5110]
MGTAVTSAAPPNGRGNTRSSLACLLCRSRHLKCDGVRPRCNRCVETAKQCQYTQSRRGGLDRAALAERRRRLEAADRSPVESANSSNLPQPSRTTYQQYNPSPPQLASDVGADLTNSYGSEPPGPAATLQVDIGNDIAGDPFITSYYENFHKFHPVALPLKHLMRIHQDPRIQLNLRPLIAMLRFIGHIYKAAPTDPILVQCRVLYSIALFWSSYKDESKREMDAAVQLGLDLQMFRQDFAAKYGAQDAVLTECWRRTWWMLYIVDAVYAGTLGAANFVTVDVEATVDLPCEEADYEKGQIPEPQTLHDFDCRELAPESTSFSSFAYLVGAVRCSALAISTAPKVAASEESLHILQAADSVINAWLLLLPSSRKQVMSKTGEIDELMFQAHLLIHVPLSDLKFNPVEWISSCARHPPRETSSPELINVHTVRVRKSIEAQIRLLALPTEHFRHSPFTTCMVSEGTLALLSACTFLLEGKELAVARDQIRMTIGCLKTLGELWPRIETNV